MKILFSFIFTLFLLLQSSILQAQCGENFNDDPTVSRPPSNTDGPTEEQLLNDPQYGLSIDDEGQKNDGTDKSGESNEDQKSRQIEKKTSPKTGEKNKKGLWNRVLELFGLEKK